MSSSARTGSVPTDAVVRPSSALAVDGLRYVDAAAPASGSSVCIAPGVHWARIPLPILDLNHINVWLLEHQDGWVVVDTGMAASMCRDAWEQLERTLIRGRRVHAIFVTHLHPDHIGLASWLQERHGAPVLMSACTQVRGGSMTGTELDRSIQRAQLFLRRHGLREQRQVEVLAKPDRYLHMTSGMAADIQQVCDAQSLGWGQRQWQAIATNGHAQGHFCLHAARDDLLISGDQVLPEISTNISLMPDGDDPDPMGSYLQSLLRLRALSEHTLVLPSHGVPFIGLHARIDTLLAHHQQQMDRLVVGCSQSQTAAQILPLLYRRPLHGMHLLLALGEALAHLEHLVSLGRMLRLDDGSETLYRAA